MKKLQIIPTALLALTVLISSCKKEEYNTESSAEPESFRVSMTDAPGDYESLTVEIESIDAYLEGSGWVNLNNQTQFVSVLDLTNGKETQLAFDQNAEFGTYSKLKLTFGDENHLKIKSSIEVGGLASTTIIEYNPSWEGPHEIEILIDESVSANAGADVLVDFNVAQSIKEDGEEYILKPAIAYIKDRATGLKGEVKGTASAALLLTNGQDSLSAYTDANGEFLIRGMEEGTYDLIVYPEQEDGEEFLPTERIENVTVVKGKIKSAGTIRF